jgi:capsular exopolysaccharide synthesis family protein
MPAAGRDAPDIMFVVRHYLWYILAGTAIGLLLGFAVYVLLFRFFPRYTSAIQFQVLPASADEFGKDQAIPQSDDELQRFIRRQALMMQRDEVINKTLESAFFTQAPEPLWVRTHAAQRARALRAAIDVSPIPQTDVFKLSVTASAPGDATAIINALKDVYLDQLRIDETMMVSSQVQKYRDARDDLERQINQQQSDMQAFRTAHDIPGLTQESNHIGTTLAELQSRLVTASTETNAARAAVESLKKSMGDSNARLTPEMDQFVQSDPRVANMRQSLLGLQQDRAVMLVRFGEGSTELRSIDIRISTANKQLQDITDEVTQRAREHAVDRANEELSADMAAEQDLSRRVDEVKTQINDLDRWIVQYNNMNEKLSSLRELLAEATSNLTRLELVKPADASRVVQYGAVVEAEPGNPSWPNMGYCLAIGLAMGGGLSLGLFYLKEVTNTQVRTPQDITRGLQLPLLGFVPDQEDDALVNGDLVTSIRTSPTSMIAESFRQIRGRLTAQANGELVHGSLLIASVSPGGGGTTVASNLATGIALNGRRVLLIDANFYRPGLRAIYQNIPALGLSEVLQGKATIEQTIVQSVDLASLSVMGAGTRPSTSAAELLESRAFADMLTTLRAKYDVVIFDGAPLSLVSDSISLASKVNGVLAVVRAGVIARGTVQRVRDQLRQVNANLIGLVLNAAQTHGSGYFKENYKTFYRYAANEGAITPAPANH